MTDTTEFEKSVIGAICIDNRILDKISSILTSDDFTISACGEVYESAQDAASRGKAFDAVYAADTISKRMGDSVAFIRECMDLCPSCTNAEYHAREIRKRAQTRNLNKAIGDKLFGIEVTKVNPQDLAADIAGICQDFLVYGSNHKYHTMAEAVGSVYNRVSNPEKEVCINSGFNRLDTLLKGFPNGSLTYIGARPSVGKTAFALALAEFIAKNIGAVSLYSLETTYDMLAERFVAKQSGVEMDKLIDCDVDKTELSTIATACGTLSSLPIKIFDTPNVSPAVIRRDARASKDARAIILDYIGLMESDKKNPQNRNLEMSSISRDLKILSKELNVPIIVLSQLNREKDEKTEPSLRDLRDSGSLEQDADKVLFMWEIEAFDDGTKQVGISVAKNKRGRLGAVKTEFNGAYMEFTEIDYLNQAERQAKPTTRKYGNGILDKEN